jgi:hypothetical protein
MELELRRSRKRCLTAALGGWLRCSEKSRPFARMASSQGWPARVRA